MAFVAVVLVAGRIDPTFDAVAVEVDNGFLAAILLLAVVVVTAVFGFNVVLVVAGGRVVFDTEEAVEVIAGLVKVDLAVVVGFNVVIGRFVEAVVGLVDAVGRFVAVVERLVAVVNRDDDTVLVTGFLSVVLAIVVGLILVVDVAVLLVEDLIPVVKRVVVDVLGFIPEVFNFVPATDFAFDNVLFVVVGFVEAANFAVGAALIVALDGIVLLTTGTVGC
ncbi:hypothetical protein BLA29_010221, partial [Euroglyphus maynei]